MSDSSTTSKFSKKDWEQVRINFSASLMVDTRLISLSQNVELPDWPIKGESETPAKYIEFSWEELVELPGLADKPGRIELLIQILKETMAFDDPFGEMVETVEIATQKENTVKKTLQELEISENCPLKFSALSPDTLDFCHAEGITTIGEFAAFSQSMAENIIVGGDFKALLNALMIADEQGIARYLPFRPHSKGLHLIESIGLLTNQLSDAERCSLLKRYGEKLNGAQAGKARLTKDQITQLEEILLKRSREMADYFKDDLVDIQKRIATGTSVERCFVVLDNEQNEVIGAHVLKRLLKESSASGDLSASVPAPKRGFLSRLFNR